VTINFTVLYKTVYLLQVIWLASW